MGGFGPFLVAELVRDPRLPDCTDGLLRVPVSSRGVPTGVPSDIPELQISLLVLFGASEMLEFNLVVINGFCGHGGHARRPPEPEWLGGAAVFRLTAAGAAELESADASSGALAAIFARSWW